MKIIIHDECGMIDEKGFNYLNSVIKQGKVSENNGIPSYCFVTKFHDGYTIYADVTKTGTHKLTITKEDNLA